jgi:hypothetical protein
VLPFTKRNIRNEEEAIHTGDFEVVASPAAAPQASSSFPPPAADRPRVFARSIADDEMTTLMPRKGMTFSVRPPPATEPAPMPKRTSSRPPKPMLEEPPTRQFMKPSAPPPPSVSPVAGPPRQAAAPVSVPMGRTALKPQPVPVESLKSDPKIDPPATVITARTRIVTARPTMSWAAALVAMGIFVGLVTAVVARGDADTLIDAAASFVDPSGGRAAASGASTAPSLQTKADSTPSSYVAVVDTLAAPPVPEAPKVAVADLPTAAPMPQRPAPVAWAAPRRAWHPAPKAAPKAAPAAERADRAEERVAAAPKKEAPKKAHADDDDISGASAADALAKAQLEASLQ